MSELLEDENAFDEAFASRANDQDEQEFETEQDDQYDQEETFEQDDQEEDQYDQGDESLSLEERLAQVEKERDDFRHKFQSNNGRIQAFQRQIDDLNAQISQQANSGKSQAQNQEDLAQEINGSSWEELVEDMPDVAQAIESRLKQEVERSLSSIQQKIQPWEERLQREALDNEIAALKSRHPDFEEIRDSQEFAEWLDNQPIPVKQLTQSTHAADAAYLLDNFKRDNGFNESQGSNLKQRNRSKLERNVSPQSKRMARRDTGDADFDMAFQAGVRSRKQR